MRGRLSAAALVLAVLAAGAASGQAPRREYKSTLPAEHAAIRAVAPAGDPVSALVARGPLTLARRPDALGYLPAVLGALDVPQESQMLVFSKTSVQAARISPERPRAIYFADQVMVAHVPGEPGLEVVAVDASRGPTFYTLGEDAEGRPRFTASTSCLRCHHGPNTAGVPGVYVGSVIPGPTGAPLRDDTAVITDHTSAFADRWGGWYVNARRGEQKDRANAVASNPADPSSLVRESRQNLATLFGLVDPSAYLQPVSDIVALMTFEHQTQATNLLTRVAWQARIAAADGGGEAARALERDLDDLAEYLTFRDEASLVEPVEGVSPFTTSFPRRGPRDARGRSLRDFDLHTRLFRYPLSYTVYGPQVDALPVAVREGLYRRLLARLTAAEAPRRPPRRQRLAAVEIVAATRPGLPSFWRLPDGASRGGR